MAFHRYRDIRSKGGRALAATSGVSPRVSLALPQDLLDRMADAAAERQVPLAHVIRESLQARYPAGPVKDEAQ